MSYWLRGKKGGALAFAAIALLVIGGLGWVTLAALRLEQEQAQTRAQAERTENLRLALWRMDSLVSPVLAQEDNRPANHYSAVFAPYLAINPSGFACSPGTVLEPSPLLDAELPDWIILHFQTSEETGWESPQVLSRSLAQRLDRCNLKLPAKDGTEKRAGLLTDLGRQFPHRSLLALLQPHVPQHDSRTNTLVIAQNPWNYNPQLNQLPANNNDSPPNQPPSQVASEFNKRVEAQQIIRNQSKAPTKEDQLDVALGNTKRNGEDWFTDNRARSVRGEQVAIHLDSMIPLWLSSRTADRGLEQDLLVFVRRVQIGKRQVCQGILIDWPNLQTLLTEKVSDLFPHAKVLPVKKETPEPSDTVMATLPIELEPGSVEAAVAREWTPLRMGLGLAWAAALIALAAVGLGGWSLIDLSERRIRFVSTVTHELRTPMTTLRLYLDMLAGGMITDEKQKTEYLQTLNTETDRLNRLVGNVLDFSRLENQRPRLNKTRVVLGELLEQVRATWQGHCQDTAKELILENTFDSQPTTHQPPFSFVTDTQLVQQILGNLIDNACKYSRGAEDRRIWLRARHEGQRLVVLEVEDRGPGVLSKDQRSIFRPFRRGQGADVTAGGVGLGLALAHRWAQLLGGRLRLQSAAQLSGACFRLELPLTSS
jgi:signal transduction histidine kinase